ncbi:porin [Gallaecimonas kandeliae]|uniref:porin n=1 Tax=Gallaecimonas kandeliae TaxID=3029055 RepID=UPI0030103E1E
MTFAKSALAAALMMGFAGTAAAADTATVYGKLNVSVESIDKGPADGGSRNDLVSNASRLGVKGAVGLTDGLEAVYQVEWEVNATDESASKGSTNNFSARNQFVGLKGSFGTALLGRNDTLLKQSQGNVDQFNDLDGDIKHLFTGENRLGDSITYMTPSFGLFSAGLSYISESNSAQRVDKVDANGKALKYKSGVSLAAMYGDAKLKKAPFFASVAYDNDVKGYDNTRATVQGKMGDFVLGGMYQHGKKKDVTMGKDTYSGFMVSGAYKVGATTLKLQYQDSDLYKIGGSNYKSTWSAGVDYKLGDATKVFGFYSTFSGMEGKHDANYLGLGLEHKF